jgi:hypothetical protein
VEVRDRTVRRLTALAQSASTARVLNLVAAHRAHPNDLSLVEKPFFQNRILNHSIIVKHRVRPHERDLFARPVSNVTKIMAPIDGKDLRLGARFLMLGQKDFDSAADEVFGGALRTGQRDRDVLELLDGLPSLDPFLLREMLKINGFEPARPYFAISDADVQRMYDFVRAEIMALVTMSAAQGGGNQAAARLVDKLLSSSMENAFEPLKETLRLSDKDYHDGIFCWRGFLYYKWVIRELTPTLAQVLAEVSAIHPRGPMSSEAREYIPGAKRRLSTAMMKAAEDVEGMLGVYDNAYRSLTLDGQPTAFRDFLLAAPSMFMKLGEMCGGIQHIVSFWNFRFPKRAPPADADELMDIFLDFEDGLMFLNSEDRRLSV